MPKKNKKLPCPSVCSVGSTYTEIEISLNGHFVVRYLVDEDRLKEYFPECEFISGNDIKNYTVYHNAVKFLKFVTARFYEWSQINYPDDVDMEVIISDLRSDDLINKVLKQRIIIIKSAERMCLEATHLSYIDLSVLQRSLPPLLPLWKRTRVTIAGQFTYIYDYHPAILQSGLEVIADNFPECWQFDPYICDNACIRYMETVSQLIFLMSADPINDEEAIDKYISSQPNFITFGQKEGILLRDMTGFHMEGMHITSEEMEVKNVKHGK